MAPPTEPCALRSSQLLKVSTRNFSWGKGGRCVWLTNYHPCSAERQENPRLKPTRIPLGHLGLSRNELYLHLYTTRLKSHTLRSVAKPWWNFSTLLRSISCAELFKLNFYYKQWHSAAWWRTITSVIILSVLLFFITLSCLLLKTLGSPST